MEDRIENSPEVIHGSKFTPVFEILIVFSPVTILIILYKLLSIESPMTLIGLIWAGYIVMFFLIGILFKRNGENASEIGLIASELSRANIIRTVLKSIGVFVFALAAFVIGSIIMANIVGIPEPADFSNYNYLSGNLPMLIISLAGVYIVSSFGEELIFRGFLISRLERFFGGDSRNSMLGALLLSSLIFGFAHFEWGAMGIVQTTFMGAALGISFILNGRGLWPLVLAHCYMDTILLVQLYFAPATQ
ncbi:MAG: CPBP family intramembrane metalloprotease [Pyrinomonadaceae bacterium]|nr:CPBP family intramembrane metalloprotease [Pyrinomonadaceae bacterium]